MSVIKAPFTKEQVKALNEWQQDGGVHPFTCSTPENAPECERANGVGDGDLRATKHGWICPCGKFTQDWAHDFMIDISA